MNACNASGSAHSLQKIAALESEVPLATARQSANGWIETAKLELRESLLCSQPMAVHVTQLQPHSGSGPLVEFAATGIDSMHAYQQARLGAIASYLHATIEHRHDVQHQTVESFLKLPGMTARLGKAAAALAHQPATRIATISGQRLGTDDCFALPLALLADNTLYLDGSHRSDERGAQGDHASCDHSIAGGASKEEALVQGLLLALEQRARRSLEHHAEHQRSADALRWLPLSQLSESIQDSVDDIAAQLQCRLRLFMLQTDHDVPLCIVAMDSARSINDCVAAGAGFTVDHAVLRALAGVQRHCVLQKWPASRQDSNTTARHMRRGNAVDTSVSLSSRLAAVPLQFQDTSIAASADADIPATLEGRVSGLIEQLAQHGLQVWCLPLELDALGPDSFVQVVLMPLEQHVDTASTVNARIAFAEAANR